MKYGVMRDARLAPHFNALTLLVETARPKRALQALRSAIAILVADQPNVRPEPHRPLAPRRNGHVDSAPASEWAPLRRRLHAVVAASNPEQREQIARAIGVRPTTLRGLCSTTQPGVAVIARTAEWLRAQECASGGVARDGADEEAEIPQKSERPEPNGAKGQTTHLTSAMCDQLALLVEADPKGVRQSGVRIETARHASLGGAIEAPIAARLVKFLTADDAAVRK
jgi:hypothetical protein